MTNKPIKSIVRLPRRHQRAANNSIGVDASELVAEQSVRDAAVAGVVVIVAFSVLWVMLSTLVNRIFPWMTVLLGILMGLVVRRAGQGLDWRFPVLAAAMTLVGSLVSNVIVAAAFTAEELDSTTFEILRAATSMTWPVFFREVISAADVVYAAMGAGAAAFFANRRLTRGEYIAWRKWQEDRTNAGSD